MRQPLVAGNWKMNGSKASIKALLDGIKQGIGDVKKAEVAVCAPFVYLPMVETELAGSAIGGSAIGSITYDAIASNIDELLIIKFMRIRLNLFGHRLFPVA